jgi:uncharacterized protein DUF6178
LQPEVLHRVIQRYGLEDCGPIVALATPDQLTRVFDLDLWRPAAPGQDEQFDPARFGTWLEVMVDAGVAGAAATVAALDVDLVAAGLSPHVRVFDYAAVAPYVTLDGEQASTGLAADEGLRCEVGGYCVSANRLECWDAITTVLRALADAHGSEFNQIMRACCRLSNSQPEVDGLDDLLTTGEQTLFDLAIDRETRRDTQGYVTPAQARAFLQASRRLDLRPGVIPTRDPITREYFRDVDAPPPVNPDDEPPVYPSRQRLDAAPDDVPAEAVAATVELLHEAGVMPQAPRALLASAPTGVPRLARIRNHLQFVQDREPTAYARRNAELAYLANVIVAGSTIQSRPLTAEEASNGAIAVCNLGLENWPADVPEDFLIDQDVVSVFQVGWTILHEDVCMYAAEHLLGVVASLHCVDSSIHEALDALRTALTKHWRAGSPWHARGALDVIAILDSPSWAAVLGFIDQFPTMHGAVGATLTGTTRPIDATAFEFISENAQIQQLRDFMQRLPGSLTG